MMNGVQAEVVEMAGVPVLRLTGELRLDASTLERQLIRLSAGRPAVVVIDLAGLIFISSLGMGYLNNFRKGVRAYGGVVKMAAAKPVVDHALRLCNFQQLFEFHDTVEAALVSQAAS
jgi:anti-anti-sigma factor